VPLSLLFAGTGVKAGTMWGFAAWGDHSYRGGHLASAESAYGRLRPLNFVDPSLAHVGIGTARYRQGDLVGAEQAFAEGLDLDAGDCEIRFDLVVTIEAQGDRLLAGDPIVVPGTGTSADDALTRTDPEERYRKALAVIDDGACPSAVADDVGDRLAATRQRIAAKLAAISDGAGDLDSPDAQASPENDRGDSEKIDDVQTRNQAGAQQREGGRDQNTGGVTPDGRSNW
jgi:hypothetical protein